MNLVDWLENKFIDSQNWNPPGFKHLSYIQISTHSPKIENNSRRMRRENGKRIEALLVDWNKFIGGQNWNPLLNSRHETLNPDIFHIKKKNLIKFAHPNLNDSLLNSSSQK